MSAHIKSGMLMMAGLCWLAFAAVICLFLFQYLVGGAGLQVVGVFLSVSSTTVLVGWVHFLGCAAAAWLCFIIGVVLCAHGIVTAPAAEKKTVARLTLLILSTVLLMGCDGGRSHVIVRALPEPTPVGTNAASKANEPSAQEEAEWARVKEHAQSRSARNWRKSYSSSSEALIARAAEAGLDSVSLSNVLEVVRADAGREKLAYLPYAALNGTRKGEAVWLVCLAWEVEGGGSLGHERYYTITAKELKQVDFATCR